MNDFTKEELIEILEYCGSWESGVGMSDFRRDLWQKIQSMLNNYKCNHESDGLSYPSNPPQNKCKKCGEFYR